MDTNKESASAVKDKTWKPQVALAYKMGYSKELCCVPGAWGGGLLQTQEHPEAADECPEASFEDGAGQWGLYTRLAVRRGCGR